jgi:2-C-methyl-D-erythritol 4-phosphate cytidylyltransferase/2-C-methyl-D-erythritol 2,4-cyclodiphosphate synthase
VTRESVWLVNASGSAVPVAAVLVAAGRSRRMGEDKLWIDLYGRPAWRWSLDLLLGVPGMLTLALVVPSGSQERYRSFLPSTATDRCVMAAGGESRRDSVLAGLSALSDAGLVDDALVLVHDAARPALTLDLVARILDASPEHGGAVPALPVPDTLMRASGEHVSRDGLVAVQTPQLGRLGELRRALTAGDFTDEGSALAAAGLEVRLVDGDPANRKLTEPGDVALMRAVLRDRARPVTPARAPDCRVGIGFDAHRFEQGRPLRLGGLDWPAAGAGLAGHSDGDVALHAVIDALLGAAGLGDIGELFPAEERWRGADSAELLGETVRRTAAAGWRIEQIDLAVVAAQPRIGPRRIEMAARIAELLRIAVDAVSVKATTSDGLGLTAGEGIAAYATASLQRSDDVA